MTVEIAGLAAATTAATPWTRLLDTVTKEVDRYQRMEKIVTDLKARDVDVTKLGARADAWVGGLNRLIDIIVETIKGFPAVQAAIDAAATVSLFATSALGLSELSPVSAWQSIVAALQKPSASPVLSGLAGLDELGWLLTAGRALYAVVKNPVVWMGISSVLSAAGPIVQTYLTGKFASETVNGSADTVEATGEALQACLEAAYSAPNDVARQAAISACQESLDHDNVWLWISVGAVGAVAAYFYFRPKEPSQGVAGLTRRLYA